MNRTVERIVASPSREREVGSTSGWVMLPVVALLPFVAAGTFLAGVATGTWPLLPAAFALLGLALLLGFGFYTLQPNEARVLVLFGRYKGTVRRAGFHARASTGATRSIPMGLARPGRFPRRGWPGGRSRGSGRSAAAG